MQNETLIAMEFIRLGLEQQAQEDFTLTQKFFIMYNLSQGFERYLKIVYSMIILGQTGELVTRAEFKRKSHGISEILKEIIKIGYHDSFTGIAEGRWGKDYLSSNPIFCLAIEILDIFGKKERYYDMDIFGGHEYEGDSPQQKWQELENFAASQVASDVYAAAAPGQIFTIEQVAYPALVSHLKWGLYAITRVMTDGENGNPTRGWPQHFLDYIFNFGPPGDVYKPYL